MAALRTTHIDPCSQDGVPASRTKPKPDVTILNDVGLAQLEESVSLVAHLLSWLPFRVLHVCSHLPLSPLLSFIQQPVIGQSGYSLCISCSVAMDRMRQ